MHLKIRAGALLAACLVCLTTAVTAAAPAEPKPAPAAPSTVPAATPAPAPPAPRAATTFQGASYFDLASRITGRSYRIFVYRPPAAAPAAGYPLLLLTDGNGLFPIAGVFASEMDALFGNAGAVGNGLIVGVGYPTDDFIEPMRLRTRDLTPAATAQTLHASPALAGARPEDYGGAEDFYRFLVEELRPWLAARYAIDPARQTLYGHSLGGLFTLGVLFRHPEAFGRYAISSPSIWYANRVVLADEAGFARRVAAGGVAPRVLIMVGAGESGADDTVQPPPGVSSADIERMTAQARMVGNAADLYARLSALKGPPGYRVQYQPFENEFHITVLPASLSRAWYFAMRP